MKINVRTSGDGDKEPRESYFESGSVSANCYRVGGKLAIELEET